MTKRKHLIMTLLSLACAEQADARDRPLAAPTPPFDVATFFLGKTEGEGRLKVVMRKTKTVRVHGSGSVDASGNVTLNQTVETAGKPSTTRTWIIAAIGNNRYGGSLTGTISPIRGVVSGNCLHLWLKMKGGLKAEQWLYLQPGGRVALNRMIIRKMGIHVATLEETIRKVD